MKPLLRSALIPVLAALIRALVAAPLQVSAQSSPDTVWATNAHYGVHGVAFSGDSASLASGGQDQTVKVWTVANVDVVRAFGVSQGAVLAVALSPDGTYVAAGDGGGQIQVVRVADGFRLWRTTPHEELINAVAFSPDGTQVADARSSGRGVLHNASDGEGTLLEGHTAAAYAVVFSPDGALVASAGADRTAILWRSSDGTKVRTLSAHSNAVYSVDFSPDGTLLASASADDTARLWRVADGEVVRVIEGGGGNAARFSADGKLLLTVNTGTINVWRVADGYLLHSYTNANAGPLAVASSGKYFAYGRSDGAVVLAWMPLWITEITQTNNEITLRWQGGRGRYQLQACRSLGSGQWQNLGPSTTNTTVTHACLAPIFYRVQSLPNP